MNDSTTLDEATAEEAGGVAIGIGALVMLDPVMTDPVVAVMTDLVVADHRKNSVETATAQRIYFDSVLNDIANRVAEKVMTVGTRTALSIND